MIVVEAETFINAPRALCFDLARNVNIHTAIQAHRQERIVAGRKIGLLELGETITFQAVHFGIRQPLKSKIVAMHIPDEFVDEMQRGAFKSLRHTHSFLDCPGGTLMRDKLEIEAPFGPLGAIAERLFLGRYMHRFLVHHQHELKMIAESNPEAFEGNTISG